MYYYSKKHDLTSPAYRLTIKPLIQGRPSYTKRHTLIRKIERVFV